MTKDNRLLPKDGFLTMSMRLTGTHRQHVTIPMAAKELMQQKIECDQCQSKFAVIGIAFFCPACGHNSVEKTFAASLKKIDDKLKHLSTIRTALAGAAGKDAAETTCRSIVESSLSDSVVAFQRYCEELFARRYPSIRVPFNAFQRLDQGSELWREATGKGYDDWLNPTELSTLKISFQRRHLLQHREGIVDEKYLKNTNDISYAIGQRIVVQAEEVVRTVGFIRELANQMV